MEDQEIFVLYKSGRIGRVGRLEQQIAWYADTFPELNFFYANPKEVRST